MDELEHKLARLRELMARHGLQALLLQRVSSFATCLGQCPPACALRRRPWRRWMRR